MELFGFSNTCYVAVVIVGIVYVQSQTAVLVKVIYTKTA